MSIEREMGLRRGFLDTESASSFADSVFDTHATQDLETIVRLHRNRPTKCAVLNGEDVSKYVPSILDLTDTIKAASEEIVGEELELYPDPNVAVNINITEPGGSYRWHYDRNFVTAILYLNTIKGGETEAFPDYRIHSKNARAQRFLDGVLMTAPVRKMFGSQVVVAPKAGDLFILRGSETLHSVRPVEGDVQRISALFAFTRLGEEAKEMPELDRYIFTGDNVRSADPNYSVV